MTIFWNSRLAYGDFFEFQADPMSIFHNSDRFLSVFRPLVQVGCDDHNSVRFLWVYCTHININLQGGRQGVYRSRAVDSLSWAVGGVSWAVRDVSWAVRGVSWAIVKSIEYVPPVVPHQAKSGGPPYWGHLTTLEMLSGAEILRWCLGRVLEAIPRLALPGDLYEKNLYFARGAP